MSRKKYYYSERQDCILYESRTGITTPLQLKDIAKLLNNKDWELERNNAQINTLTDKIIDMMDKDLQSKKINLLQLENDELTELVDSLRQMLDEELKKITERKMIK